MKYLNAINKIFGVGPQKMKLLLDHFERPGHIWSAGLADLRAAGLGPKTAENILAERKKIDPEAEWEKLEKENIQLITFTDERYPALLKEISHPPYLLYVKGEVDCINGRPMISIVGSRKFTSYGQQTAWTFAKDLAGAGIRVASGMAIGIDTFAHRGALEAGGKSIAVLGNSLDDMSIYPKINLNLAREITRSGALISEYPPETAAGPLTFPARNRIVAGLSFGTLVVEAGVSSGALITAQMALDANREVFSVPGPIYSTQSLGTNNLIKNGARMVTSVKDILEELDLSGESEKKPSPPKVPDNENEKKLLAILSSDPLHVDNIAKLSKLNTATVSSALAIMEIKGWARNIGGQNYILL
jgi:DNA processing protein